MQKSIPIFIGIFDKKGQGHPPAGGPLFVRPTHKDSDCLKVDLLFILVGRRVCIVLCVSTGGADFSLALLMYESDL